MEEPESGQRVVTRFRPAGLNQNQDVLPTPRTASSLLAQQIRNSPRNQVSNNSPSTSITSKSANFIPAKRVLDLSHVSIKKEGNPQIVEVDSSSEEEGMDQNVDPYHSKPDVGILECPPAKRPRKSIDSGYEDLNPSYAGDSGNESATVISVTRPAGSSNIRKETNRVSSLKGSNSYPRAGAAAPSRIYHDDAEDNQEWSLEKLQAELQVLSDQKMETQEEMLEISDKGGGRSAAGHDIGYCRHIKGYLDERIAELRAQVMRAEADYQLRQTSASPRFVQPPIFVPKVSASRHFALDAADDSKAAGPSNKLSTSSTLESSQASATVTVRAISEAKLVSKGKEVASKSNYFETAVKSVPKSTSPKPLSRFQHPSHQSSDHSYSPEPVQSTSRLQPQNFRPSDKKGKARAQEVDLEALLEGVDFDGNSDASENEETVEEEDEELLPARNQRRFVPDAPVRRALPQPSVSAPRKIAPPPPRPVQVPPPKVVPPKVAVKDTSMIEKGLDPARVSSKPQITHPWSRDVSKALRQRFGLAGFRKNQEDAINATLSGKDVFVLLPTGGGKSLCFQLPAVIQSGSTRGVTIVVSPLLSLISDQCKSLIEKDIPVIFINGQMPAADRSFAMSMLQEDPPRTCLAYVTPELIANSGQFGGILKSLFNRRQLARFVIDEAHCVSSWGHDFRPDYKQMSCLKKDYPGIPLIALTATANSRVKNDVLDNLGMKNALVLTQSFNRPNLKYEVRPKTKKVIEDMARFIREHHNGECGIIYCHSKAKCEETADKLRREYKIEARHYHAGMNKDDRARIQLGWQDGDFPVICATIAFGMGIDKADVRYVIHFSLSSSLEAYYQETGRAGRDGKTSICVLFFTYADTRSITHLIDQGEGTYVQKQYNKDNLRRVVQYCLNLTDCRRSQVLSYFGEKFPKEKCHNTCDNCLKGDVFELRDVTAIATTAVQLVQELEHQKGITSSLCVSILRGSKIKKILDNGYEQLEWYGSASKMELGDVERLFQLLTSEDVLGERFETVGAGHTHSYVITGRRKRELLNGPLKLSMAFSDKKSKFSRKNPVEEAEEEEEEGDEEEEAVEFYEEERDSQLTEEDVSGDGKEAQCLRELLRSRKQYAAQAGKSPSAIVLDDILQIAAATFPISATAWIGLDPGNDDGLTWFISKAKSICLKYSTPAGNVKASSTSKQSSVPGTNIKPSTSKPKPPVKKAPIKKKSPVKKSTVKKVAKGASKTLDLQSFKFETSTAIKAMPIKKK